MRCSGCGKEIPFVGEVCPNCQRDKSGDQQTQTLAMFFGFIGGAIGWFISGIGAAIIGMIVGVVVGMIMAAMTGAGKTQAPKVRIVDSPESTKISQEASAATSRLASLESLKSQGLITEAEFNAKRQEVLETL